IKRVIHVVSDMHRGGAETMIMNIYRNIDRNKIQFDFICHYSNKIKRVENDLDYENEILNLGGRIFRTPSLGTSNPLVYINNIKNILKDNGPFVAIHIHTNKQGGFPLLGARLAGIKNRIIHSHTTEWNFKNKLYSSILKFLINTNSTKFCACGKEAAINAFGKSKFLNNVIIINNSIDINKFININRVEVNNLRSKLGISEEKIIIGHIGRFDLEKNHNFIINLANKIRKCNKEFLILLIGDGPNKNEIDRKISRLNLEKYVKILGVRKDVNILMNLFDIFILPSLFEGLPLVAIEAQAAGKRCIVSDKVTDEIDMGLNLVKHLPIDEKSLDEWEKTIFNIEKLKIDKTDILKKISEKGYNIFENLEIIYKLYDV
ncbi:glycosyltransferase, partial [Clostridium perfringens]